MLLIKKKVESDTDNFLLFLTITKSKASIFFFSLIRTSVVG